MHKRKSRSIARLLPLYVLIAPAIILSTCWNNCFVMDKIYFSFCYNDVVNYREVLMENRVPEAYRIMCR